MHGVIIIVAVSSDLLNSIEQHINRLRQQIKLNAIASWRDLTLLNIIDINHDLARSSLEQCPTAVVNEKGYIVFERGRQTKWLGQRITVPATLQTYPLSGLSLRLVLTWWAEVAEVFVNGRLVQQGDLFDSSARVLLSDRVEPGQEYLVAIRLVSPAHDIGALMRSHLVYEKLNTPSAIDPGLVADEITVLSKYLAEFAPQELNLLAAALDRLSWHKVSEEEKFAEELAQLRSQLLPLARQLKQRRFHLLGHAHLDMAWLWTTEETYQVAERTFKSVLNLQQDFPALTFGHTSPALYQWLEQHRPELFAQIQAAFKNNQWEILGGMWIEPETNLVSGESLIRQLIYGQEYYLEKFGEISQVAWLPDSFGFTWQLPQIFWQCGIKYFVTGKLHWNDTNPFPLGCFWWKSPDGTKLLTLMSPPNVTGVMDTNPLTMTDYALKWETQTGMQDMFWLPGVGDHGGGPTKDMLEVAQKWHDSPFFPEIDFSKSIDYLDAIARDTNKAAKLPVWQDELYLELHRGCYTVHSEQKQFNRYCERLLYQAELWSSMATLLCDRQNEQSQIATAWKKVLFNQFHDILPGTSIPEVFIEANRDWQAAIAIGENVLKQALEAITQNIKLPTPPQSKAQPLVVFNSLNWLRSSSATIEDERFSDRSLDFWVCDQAGNKTDEQKLHDQQLTFTVKDIPGVGYQLYWLCWQKLASTDDLASKFTANSYTKYELENQYLKVVINPNTGNIDSIFDRHNQQEVLSEPGNKLEAFEDKGQYWDAWNIDPEYAQKQLPDTILESITWLDSTLPTIRVVKQLNQSRFTQDYILEVDSPILKISNIVDWQETHVMVKASFPLQINSDRVTSEIPCGTITRPTKPQTAAERAKWEVSALNWSDLTNNDGTYGVSLLNNCKYGYDAQSDHLRLTLLRSPLWPDPSSDQGRHHFIYAIYPHQNNWQAAKTVQKGYELNTPLQIVIAQDSDQENQRLPTSGKLLSISPDNLILTAFKLSAQQKQKPILRLYEAHGEESTLEIASDLDLTIDAELDALETTSQPIEAKIQPYKIKTYETTMVEKFRQN